MTRQEFWQHEFSKAATELSTGPQREEDNMDGKELAEEAANWADLALAEFDKRFFGWRNDV